MDRNSEPETVLLVQRPHDFTFDPQAEHGTAVRPAASARPRWLASADLDDKHQMVLVAVSAQPIWERQLVRLNKQPAK